VKAEEGRYGGESRAKGECATEKVSATGGHMSTTEGSPHKHYGGLTPEHHEGLHISATGGLHPSTTKGST
jgi:hypothetical protein